MYRQRPIGYRMAWVFLIPSLLASAGLAGAECIDYTSYLNWDSCTPSAAGINDLAIAGATLYAAEDGSGFEIFDISDPQNVQAIGYMETQDDCQGIAVSGSYLFTAEGYSGVLVYDISIPEAPQFVHQIDTPGWARRIAIQGDLLCVADGSSIQVISIADPPNSVVVGSLPLTVANDVAFIGNQVGVACGSNGYHQVGLSDPAHPVRLGSVDTPGYALGVAIMGSFACVADDDGDLAVIDISDAHAPVIYSTLALPGLASDVAVAGSHAFLAMNVKGIVAVDLTNPSAPVQSGAIPGFTSIHCLTISDGILFGGGNQGLSAGDISNPTSPDFIGSFWVYGSESHEVAVEQNLAVVADGDNLKVLDVTDPAAPVLAGTCALSSSVWHVAVSGSYAFAPDTEALKIISLADPENPTVVGIAPDGSYAHAVEVSDGLAYVARGGLYIIDVTDPQHPVTLGYWHPYGTKEAFKVAVDGDIVYVGTYDPIYEAYSIHVLDVSNPASPQQLVYWTCAGIGGLSVSGHFLYAATNRGLRIWDVANPSMPQPAGTLPEMCEGPLYDVAVLGGVAYVMTTSSAMLLIDVSDPGAPRPISSLRTPYWYGTLATANDLVYVANLHSGLLIAPTHCESPSAVEVGPAASLSPLSHPVPNPTTGPCSAQWRLTAAGPVQAQVFDAAGRMIRTLFDGRSQPGEHSLAWDGLDSDGRPAATGVYYIRLTTPEGKASGRITILR